MKKKLITLTCAALLATGTLMLTAGSASAYVVCNRDGGDCWHSDSRVRVPHARFEYHNDNWYFHHRWDGDNDRHYRDYHQGRGYYRGGLWITL